MKFIENILFLMFFSYFSAGSIFQSNADALKSSRDPYYGQNFYQALSQDQLHNDELKEFLYRLLEKNHIHHDNGEYDEIVDYCLPQTPCSGPTKYNYTQARQFLFGQLELETSQSGDYQLHTIYCEKTLNSSDFPRNHGPGPGRIPDSSLVNVEHAWPQSKFNPQKPILTQKTDLFILYPALPSTNTIRGNHPFGIVDKPLPGPGPCPEAKIGYINEDNSQLYFEPPAHQRGNLARSIFYFSVRYQSPIDPIQEHFLRDWHNSDPVDQKEYERNQKIYEFQHTRNPFIDHPELVDLINDF